MLGQGADRQQMGLPVHLQISAKADAASALLEVALSGNVRQEAASMACTLHPLANRTPIAELDAELTSSVRYTTAATAARIASRQLATRRAFVFPRRTQPRARTAAVVAYAPLAQSGNHAQLPRTVSHSGAPSGYVPRRAHQ